MWIAEGRIPRPELASIETIRRDFGVIVTELQMRAGEFFPTPTSSTSVRDANG
jgi:hypothetical protein